MGIYNEEQSVKNKITLDRVPRTGTYRKVLAQKQKTEHLKMDQGTQMLMAALFRIAKVWK